MSSPHTNNNIFIRKETSDSETKAYNEKSRHRLLATK